MFSLKQNIHLMSHSFNQIISACALLTIPFDSGSQEDGLEFFKEYSNNRVQLSKVLGSRFKF